MPSESTVGITDRDGPRVRAARRPTARSCDEIVAALARHGGDKQRVADELGISLKTVYNKIKAYGLK